MTPPQEKRAKPVAEKAKAEDRPSPETILVAEDEHILARSLSNDLGELGYQVIGPAPNGQKALDLARQTRPDMALLDIRMPKLDGLSAAQHLYDELRVPVVILSAYSDPPYLKASTRNGVFGYLIKPVTMDELRVTLAIAWARYHDLAASAEQVSDLEKRLENRKTIERAKGILMDTQGMSEQEAMTALQKRSRDTRQPMVALAKAIIDANAVVKECDNAPSSQRDKPTPPQDDKPSAQQGDIPAD